MTVGLNAPLVFVGVSVGLVVAWTVVLMTGKSSSTMQSNTSIPRSFRKV